MDKKITRRGLRGYRPCPTKVRSVSLRCQVKLALGYMEHLPSSSSLHVKGDAIGPS